MVARSSVVAHARNWLGTPFQHQARLRGVGADCGGLLGGVAIDSGVVAPGWWEEHFDPLYLGYSRAPTKDNLLRILDRYMLRISCKAIRPADVLVFVLDVDPQHIGIVADYRHGGLSVIHAMMSPPKVAEHRLTTAWLDKVCAAYQLPGVFDG